MTGRREAAGFLVVAAVLLAALVALPSAVRTQTIPFPGPGTSCGIGGNDGNTKSLLHFDGTNGSTTAPDTNRGGGAHTWTATGTGATLSTTGPKFGTASAAFTVAASYFSTPNSADFALGSGNFTIDFWFKTSSANRMFAVNQYDGTNAGSSFDFEIGQVTAGFITIAIKSGGGNLVSLSTTVTAYNDGAFHHYAIVRNGTNWTQYVDGTANGTTTASGTVNTSTAPLVIGYDIPDANFSFVGNIDEFRFSSGVARWTANFTPPTTYYCPY